MSQAATILRVLVSPMALPGTFMAFMGLGIAPLDPALVAVANVWLEPLSIIPVKPFFLFLGSAKVLGVASLWGYGPVPKTVGIFGLMTSALCASYAHAKLDEPFVPGLVAAALLTSLYVLDRKKDDKKKE